MFKKIAMAFTGIIAGFGLLLGLTSTGAGAAPQPDDCNRVAKSDRALCQQVKGQFPYAYVTRGGNVAQVVSGKVLVREITHQGLTKGEMHSYLTGEATQYRRYATGSQSVVINLASLRNAYGTDAQYDVGFHDVDGKPGGKKDIRVELDLP